MSIPEADLADRLARKEIPERLNQLIGFRYPHSRIIPPIPFQVLFDLIKSNLLHLLKNHGMGATVGPTIWPTPILIEGDSLAFDILAVASSGCGSAEPYPPLRSVQFTRDKNTKQKLAVYTKWLTRPRPRM